MRKCKHFLYEESVGFFFGEVGRVSDPEGLLQIGGLDENSEFAEKPTPPQSPTSVDSSQRNSVGISRHLGASEARHT